MKINKPLDIDLNIISPQKHIRIHEGDIDSVDILIGVTVDDESVDLSGVTIKYDATINNYLAEQDANGSVVNDKISIPVTQNMTAMSGLLLIDVRMIQSDQVLFTQTICATVEKAVVNGSTYIDFDKITIVQRMNALEEKMDYIEELVNNFDTSKLIVSVNRPPSGAPVEVDVDLLRVGDTWILSGANIVYKLVEAQYNYQPVPSAEPYHKFIWQPLNERYGVGNTEPPTSATYQAVVYTINEVQWSWLPVPEYFKGDHYQMQVGVDDPTYYICKSASMPITGVCTYTWREEGGSIDAYTKAETNELLADKMDLAPLNPTAAQISAMSAGQLYGDTVNHKGVIKTGANSVQEFYDTTLIDSKLSEKSSYPVTVSSTLETDALPKGQIFYYMGGIYIKTSPTGQSGYRSFVFNDSLETILAQKENKINYHRPYFRQPITEPNLSLWGDDGVLFILLDNGISGKSDYPIYLRIGQKTQYDAADPMVSETNKDTVPCFYAGDKWVKYSNIDSTKQESALEQVVYICTRVRSEENVDHTWNYYYTWKPLPIGANTIATYGITDAYTKTEINSMIGDIESALAEV